MPFVFGEFAASVEEVVRVFEKHGDRVRGTYKAYYHFDGTSTDVYAAPRLERPESLAESPPNVVYPWEQIFLSAAVCAGSDYPMLAAHFGIPLVRVDFVVEGDFDPRAEFAGLAGYSAPNEVDVSYRALHLRATLQSPAHRSALARLHARVLSNNMVLNALRGIPQSDELITIAVDAPSLAELGGQR